MAFFPSIFFVALSLLFASEIAVLDYRNEELTLRLGSRVATAVV